MEHIPPPGTWRKSNANRVKVQYKTLDEVISEGGAQRYGMFATTSSVGKVKQTGLKDGLKLYLFR